ncbi:uncharacterized protein LOC133532214 [Cydia pomonella]|uniref:uncharacterized protein LOC133532214 n=1 Tax=Cydia pomonella TaxID=82600 RepID=UPI002ADE641F|nr:uncharacterized protein LOC133532214 [Cydia pomonella]
MSEKNSCQNNRQNEKSTSHYCDVLLRSQEDRNRTFSKLCHGDVSVLGKIWICTLRAFLLGFQYPLSGVTSTNKIPKCEEKLRVSKVIVECPKEETQDNLLHNMVLPYVTKARRTCQGIIGVSRKGLTNTCDEIKSDISRTGENIIKYFRDEENYNRRVQLVASGGMLGYLKPGGLPTRFFCAACGLAGTGMLCFPEETDATIRKISYFTGNAVMKGYYFITDRKPPDERNISQDFCKSPREK